MRKVKQKRSERKLLVALCASLLFVGACGSVEAMSPNFLEEVLSNNKEIAEGQAFYEQQEAENAANGENEEPGTVEQPEQIEQIDTTGKVKVTFAENSLLNVSYYSDAELTKKIEKENCYLEPEACIYASVPESKEGTSSKYKFDGFRVYEYDENGEKKLQETILPSEDKLVYKITAVTEGDGIAIVPVGAYEKRVITLSDYVVNANGEKQELGSETWKVNNKEYFDEEMEINPLISYVVSYEYDKDEYYFVSAAPESACHYPTESGNTDGEVFFRVQESESTIENFSVELQKYRTVIIDNKTKGLKSIKISNDKNRSINHENKEAVIDRLQCGNTLEIITNKEHKLVCNKYDFSTVETMTDGYKYTFVVPENADEVISITVYEWDQKDISITLDGEEIGANWWEKLTGKDKDKQSLLTIEFGEEKKTYEELKTGDKLTLNENDKLTIAVSQNIPEGIQVHIVIDNDNTFDVDSSTDNSERSKELSYDDISKSLRITVLNQENKHIPENKVDLKVTLEDSLKNSKNIFFSVEASGGDDKVAEVTYIKGSETIFNKVIDAEQKIVLSAKNIQLYGDTALKISIKKSDGTKEIRYCNKSNMYETISPIKDNTGKITEYYRGMDISIGLVDVYTYRTRTGSNYTVSVCFADENQTKLLDGDILEGSRMVVLTITAANGYYIAGDKYIENNTVYRREMKYADYVEQIDTILSKNPVKKFITASVDVSAPYQAGTVTVVVNGKVRITETDTYWFMEGDKVEFTLELNKDSGYYIVGTGLWDKDLDGKQTGTITITPNMEGTVLSAGDCIEVKKEN